MPGLSTLQCYCSGYSFHLRSRFGESAQSNLARDQLSLLPRVAKKVLKITSSKHKGFGRFSMHALHGIGRATPRAFPAQRRGRSPRNAQSQQTPLFCGYDVTCAAPSPLIVQRRALCLCNADPCAFLMPGQFRSLCHGFTHWAHPTVCLPLAVPTQPCAKR